jgi:hypothetical protein
LFGGGELYAFGGGRAIGIFDGVEYYGGSAIGFGGVEWNGADTGGAECDANATDFWHDADRADEHGADADGDELRGDRDFVSATGGDGGICAECGDDELYTGAGGWSELRCRGDVCAGDGWGDDWDVFSGREFGEWNNYVVDGGIEWNRSCATRDCDDACSAGSVWNDGGRAGRGPRCGYADKPRNGERDYGLDGVGGRNRVGFGIWIERQYLRNDTGCRDELHGASNLFAN